MIRTKLASPHKELIFYYIMGSFKKKAIYQQSWVQNKVTRERKQVKRNCRNLIAESLEKLDQFDETQVLTKKHISFHNNYIKAYVIIMRNQVPRKQCDIAKNLE
jgi:hypothetical protein